MFFINSAQQNEGTEVARPYKSWATLCQTQNPLDKFRRFCVSTLVPANNMHGYKPIFQISNQNVIEQRIISRFAVGLPIREPNIMKHII